MATVTTYGRYNEVSGGNIVEDGKVYVHNSATADAFTFPADAPVGFTIILFNIGAGVATLTAPAGESVAGNTATLAQNETAIVKKTAATVWTASSYAANV